MDPIRQLFRKLVDERARDSFYALRTRGDASVFSGTLRGGLGWLYKAGSNREHLEAAMAWLCAAQNALEGGGVSALYDMRSGTWGPPYPETTGYIIPTFFDFAALSGLGTYRERAIRMADWLLTLQLENGAFPIGPLWPEWERAPIVFDTGQILHGLARAFEETGSQKYLDSACRAGDWLAEIQEPNGNWEKHVSQGYVHTFNVRSAWGMLRLYESSKVQKHLTAATANLDWALTQQDPDGWFRNAGFQPEVAPLTHTIAYTIEGLLESGIQLSDQRYIDAARLAANALRKKQLEEGFLRARYGPGWISSLNWSCLTGTAQMALVWLRLYQVSKDEADLSAALEANRYVKQRQPLRSPLPGVRGGIAGSYPIYCEYEPYRNLNWPVKFFADSLMLAERLYVGDRG
jgi:uncharacterized protein YyaL (SSP411 family)